MADIVKISQEETSDLAKLAERFHAALALPISGMRLAMQELVGADLTDNLNVNAPEWLVDGTNFDSDVWSCYFGLTNNKPVVKIVSFDIYLANGSCLLDPENSNVLKWIKLFLSVQIHPQFNGGARRGAKYEQIVFIRALKFVDWLLLNDSAHFDIGNLGFSMVSINDITSFLVESISTPIEESLYSYPKRLERWLRFRIGTVSSADIARITEQFPEMLTLPMKSDRALGLTDQELVKARVHIHLEGLYDYCPEGRRYNPRPFIQQEYRNTLHGVYMMPRVLPDLSIGQADTREFPGVPIKQNPTSGLTLQSIRNFLRVVGKVAVVEGFYNVHGVSPTGVGRLNAKKLFELALQKSTGRIVTLPYAAMVHALGESFEYIYSYKDIVFDAVLKILHDANSLNNRVTNVDLDLLVGRDPRYEGARNAQIEAWFKPRDRFADGMFYADLRSRKYLYCSYMVLMGAFLIVIGSLVSRRQSELIDLDATECLDPPDNPYLEQNKNKSYCLLYLGRKTGSRTQHVTMSLGITLPLAKILWDFMQFRRSCERFGFVNSSSSLLMVPDARGLGMLPMTAHFYNAAIDYACDYFESYTAIVDDRVCRYYIRQHQLRRFSVLLLYHTGGGGLDLIRHVLGHADVEHVYNYLTESMPGATLELAKAEAITDYLYDGDETISGLEWLKTRILKTHSSQDFVFRTIEEVRRGYAPLVVRGLKRTHIPLCDVLDLERCLSEILTLVKSRIIDLTPDYFEYIAEGGNVEQRFNFVIKILGES